MADTNAEADIRGINISKVLRGFADEANIFKNYVRIEKTKAREMRWYQKTAGFLDTEDTTGMTLSKIPQVASKAVPYVMEQSFTRNTFYVKKFMIDSPWLSMEDLKDNDVDILRVNLRDLKRGLDRKVDLRIFSVLVEAAAATPTVPNPSSTNTGAATADGWNDAATGDPITDILVMKQAIRSNGYDPEGAILCMNSIEHRFLIQYLINVKGSSIPSFAADLTKKGNLMHLLGTRIVVSENWTTDSVGMWIPSTTMAWKSFAPMSATTINDPGIATKIRVWEEGEAVMTDPLSAYILTDTTA